MYIARDKNNDLRVYLEKPQRMDDVFFTNGNSMKIDQDDFKDVTWENSPRKIKCCPRIIDELNYHFDTTPKEELDKEFEELEPLNNVGPTVEEYLGGINYNEVRTAASIHVMNAIMTGCQEFPDSEDAADMAVEYADALVNRLKKS